VNNLVYLIPLFAAFIGWFISWGITKILFQPTTPVAILGFKLQGIFPKYQKFIATQLATIISKEIVSLSDISSKISSPSSIEKVIPFVDEKVDHFLRVKLAERMPMISMFIGEATMAELKSVFMEELQVLFPELMQHYTSEMIAEYDVETMIETKILNVKPTEVAQTFKLLFAKPLNNFIKISTLFGFIIGVLQLLLVIIAR
jgi:uncharacterized membrane protein YheB (UPF0754 family)